jgi:hypothetical protein
MRRNERSVITSARSGDTVVTLAVRGSFVISEISPKKSPSPSVRSFLFPRVTSAVPLTITKNSRPAAPSWASSLPSLKSISSAIRPISSSSLPEQREKSGTCLSSFVFAFFRSSIARL